MRLLLDTHVLLWALADDPSLSTAARAAIVDGRNRVVASAVSAWEITIKRSLGKLRTPADLAEAVAAHRFTPLAVSLEHALAVGALPDLHRDPFDRLLVAQAGVEGLTIVTRDRAIARYDVDVLGA
ncbi:MAG: type II toxin-antitoxin system VapC family toxin [Egibacteraceae bacterium]